MLLPALEKIMGSKLLVRWVMSVLHKVHSLTPKKNSPFFFDTCQTQRVCPCLCCAPFHDLLKITSISLHCFFRKFCQYFLLWALFQFLFGFDQPKSINGASNFLRFQSKLFVKSPIGFFVQHCLYWCIEDIYKNQKTIIFHLHLLVFWLLTPLQCFPSSCTSCKHISVCALYFKIFCCLFDFMDVFVVSIFS